jgi:deoxyhypusine synthase
MKAKRRSKSPEEINAALAAKKGPISRFIAKNYRHFNAAALLDAAKGYENHLAAGGKMLMTVAGAMSTAELGISLAEMIRRDKVHLIVCTGANLEEDIFNLVAGAARPAHEPRDRHLHPGNGSDAADRKGRARRVDRGRPRRRALFPA